MSTESPGTARPPPSRLARFAPLVGVGLTMLGCCALWVVALYGLGAWRSGTSYLKSYRHATSAEARIALAMEYAERSTEANDVLLVGDATGESVSVAALERATGLRAWSLCVAGIVESDGIALLLERYLAHHPRPRLVVLVRHSYSLLWSQVQRSQGLGRSRYDFLRRYEPARRERLFAPDEERELLLQEGWRDVIGVAFRALGRPLADTVDDCDAIAGSDAPFGFAVPPEAVLPDVRDRCPGVPLRRVRAEYLRSRGGEGGALQAVDLTLGGIHPDGHLPMAGQMAVAHNDQAMDEVVRPATRRGIPVALRFTPLRGDPGEWSAVVEGWLAGFAARNRGVALPPPHLLSYDPGLYADSLHLNDRGAERLTAQVIDDVRAALGGAPAEAPAR